MIAKCIFCREHSKSEQGTFIGKKWICNRCLYDLTNQIEATRKAGLKQRGFMK